MDQNAVLSAIGLQEIVVAWQAARAELAQVRQELEKLRLEHAKCAKPETDGG